MGQVIEVQGGHPEHGTCSLGIAGRYDGRLDVLEAALLEEGVNGEGHGVPYAGHGPEGVCPGPQVSNLTQKFRCVTLLLQRVGLGFGVAEEMDLTRLNFKLLSLALGLHHIPDHADAATRGQGVGDIVEGAVLANHHLQVPQRGTVVHLHEGDRAGRATSLYPSLHQCLAQWDVAGEYFPDPGSLH